MGVKVYQSIYFQFSTFVEVDKKKVPIEFKGGVCFGDMEKKGVFITNDEKLQAAIEADPRFKWEFCLKEEREKTKIQASVPEKDKEEGVKDPVTVDTITDFQLAKEYLRKEYDIPHQSLNTPENILKKASEVGVLFPNLKQVQE